MRDFREGNIRLLRVDGDLRESRLRLPGKVRDLPAPWAGRTYDELDDERKQYFDSFQIDVFEIDPNTHSDEVRDLFIRLQSGTALTRQQIRDAWPGNLGPFIESIAGKLAKKPSHRIFSLIDRRGYRADEDEKDEYVTNRQLACQLLKIFLARDEDALAYPSVSAGELDGLYHSETNWEPGSPRAQRFLRILDLTAQVLEELRGRLAGQKKFKRIDVSIIMMYLQDVTRSKTNKLGRNFITAVANNFVEATAVGHPSIGKGTAAFALKQSYEWWRNHSPDSQIIHLDTRRAFSTKQKNEMWNLARGACQICMESVVIDDAEYDHYPIPYRDGGATEISNGRLVHARCHPRGRPIDD